MKIQPIQQVTGIRIELTIAEAVRLVQTREESRDRVIDAISGTLRGSGIDPETGKSCKSSLGLTTQGSMPLVMALTGPSQFDDQDDDQDDEHEGLLICPYCQKELRTERGLQVHISRMHKR